MRLLAAVLVTGAAAYELVEAELVYTAGALALVVVMQLAVAAHTRALEKHLRNARRLESQRAAQRRAQRRGAL